MSARISAAAIVSLVVLVGACKKTGEGEFQVQVPEVGTDTKTVRTPDVDIGKETTMVVTPTIDIDKRGKDTTRRDTSSR